jgi:hypothetical protein
MFRKGLIYIGRNGFGLTHKLKRFLKTYGFEKFEGEGYNKLTDEEKAFLELAIKEGSFFCSYNVLIETFGEKIEVTPEHLAFWC